MAKVDVIMPQMGESVTEGTITRWMKKVGDHVKRDEPLFEISTDKVDAEIPAPREGKLVEIKIKEGQTAPVNTVVAILETEAGEVVSKAEETPKRVEKREEQKPVTREEEKRFGVVERIEPTKGKFTAEERRLAKSSPLVRKIAREQHIDISQIEGSGLSGRVTKKDILSFIEKGVAPRREEARRAEPLVTPTAAAVPRWEGETRAYKKPMSTMRKKIAEHMVFSKHTSAHVTTVFEVDMTKVVKLRDKAKDEFAERYGTKLTFMPFFFQAVIKGLQEVPVMNASVAGDDIVFHREINLGMAVALDWGLIVPVIKRAEELSIVGLARAANDLAQRARERKLKPDEVAGGTFTITNPGIYGSLFGTPIINQPQVGILDIGAIKKRPVVIEDFIAIRSMVYLAVSYDHRLVDGAVADEFMNVVKDQLESGSFSPLA